MAVGIFAGPLQLGYYSLADRVRTAGMQLLHPVTHALFPRMCNLYAENREEAVKLLLKSGLIILSASLAISVAMFFFSPLIIHFLGGSEFEPSIHILKIISFTVVITITFEFLMYQWLVVTHMDRLLNYSRVIPLVVALVLMYTMISSDGARGAAWLSVLCESLSTIIVIFGLRKGFRYRNE